VALSSTYHITVTEDIFVQDSEVR